MKTLVLVEHDGSTVKDPTLPAVTAAAQIGEVHLLVIGSNVGAVGPKRRKSPVSARSMSPMRRSWSIRSPRHWRRSRCG